MPEVPIPSPHGPTRRSLVKTAAWSAPVVLASYSVPAMAASGAGTGTISWITPSQILGAGYRGTIQGQLNTANGTPPTSVTLSYSGTSVTGPTTVTVGPSGIFSLGITALSYETKTTVTATATGYTPAGVDFGVFVSSPNALTFVPATKAAGNIQPAWTAMADQYSNGIHNEQWTMNPAKIGTDLAQYAITLTGTLTSQLFGLTVPAGTGMNILGVGEPTDNFYWHSPTDDYTGDAGKICPDPSGMTYFRGEVGANGAAPFNNHGPAIAAGDTKDYSTVLRVRADTPPHPGSAVTDTVVLYFDTVPNFGVMLHINY